MGNCFSVSLSCDPLLLRCWDCASQEVVFMRQMKDKLKDLETEKENLIDMQREVSGKVTEEERQGRQRLPTVGRWLSRVEHIIPEIDDLLQDGKQEVKRLCFGGRFSKNCKSSIKFGKLVADKLTDVVNLKRERLNFNQVATSPPAEVLEQPCGPTVGLESTLEKVCSCIREERAERIGLCGLGGVGKTTLLKQLNNKYAGACKDFDPVIWEVVSQKFEIDNVQEEIWKQIRSPDEQWKCKRTEEKAVDIHNVLLKKKFLLLLDDVWEAIDFEKVGIPSNQKGSHVVFTTRSKTICSQMDAQLIKVEPLQWPEAWALFQKKVGQDTLTSDERITPLAKRVAEKCDGLPIALITVGRAMAGKNAWQAWEHAIEVLTKAASSLEHTGDEELFEGIKKEVFVSLKFSYDSLPNDRVKSCFLYCSLFPEDYKIVKQWLIDLWICETFWGDYDDLTKARNKGYDILNHLINSCMIEDGGDYVKMHDVVRDMALWLTHKSEERKETFLVQARANLVKTPAAKKWESISRMSLMMNSIAEIEEVPMSTDILTLFLRGNPLRKLPDGFFQSMKALTVLDLSSTELEELPRGLSALTSLQHLDLSRTRIKELPLEFRQLERLKHLNLRKCGRLTKIPKQVIFGLASLKVLKLINCGDEVAEDGEEAEDNLFFGCGDVREEVLRYLQSVIGELSLSIRSQSAFENISSTCSRLLSSSCIEGFGFNDPLIDISCLGTAEHLHCLKFKDLEGVEEMTVGFPMKKIDSQDPLRTHGSTIANTKICFKSLTQIILCNCGDLKHITWVALVPSLRILQIWECKSLQEVTSQNKLNDAACPFAKLETLALFHLLELKSIFWKPLPFPTLNEINVFSCPKLKKLPLNSDSAKGCNLVIRGNTDRWWENIELEDDAAKHVFQSSSKEI